MWVRSLGWENPLEEELATHSGTLAWRIPWTEELGGVRITVSILLIISYKEHPHAYILFLPFPYFLRLSSNIFKHYKKVCSFYILIHSHIIKSVLNEWIIIQSCMISIPIYFQANEVWVPNSMHPLKQRESVRHSIFASEWIHWIHTVP